MAEATAARDRADLNARRVGALQAMAVQVSGAATTAQIVEVGLDRGMEALRADGAVMYRLEPSTSSLAVVSWRGGGAGESAPVDHLPLDVAHPVTDAARLGDPVFIEHPEALARRYPPDGGPPGQPAVAAIAVVPLEVEDGRTGALAFTWDRPHELPPDRQAFIAAMGRLVSGAMERARLLEGERAARERLDLLAEAGRVLATSLDYETTLRRLAGLALPLLGDVGIVDVLEGEGVRRLVTTSSPELARPAAVIEAHPLDLAQSGPMASVLRGGNPGVFEIDDTAIDAASRSPEHAAALRSLGARWALVTPLRVLNRSTGVVAFLRREDRPYEPGEVEFATELGNRAGRALENARLHTQVERLAARELGRAAELEAVIASIGEGIVVADPAGAIAFLNAAATRLLGGPVATLDDLLGRLLDANGDRPTALAPDPTEYRLAGRPTAWVELAAYPVAGDQSTRSTVVVCRT
jgi:GAF domain-containing protein